MAILLQLTGYALALIGAAQQPWATTVFAAIAPVGPGSGSALAVVVALLAEAPVMAI